MGKKLDNLQAKHGEIEYNGTKFIVQGLSFAEIADFARLADAKKFDEAMLLLLFSALRKDLPTKEENAEEGYSDDELRETIKKLDSGFAMKIVEKVQELSGMTDAAKKLQGAM